MIDHALYETIVQRRPHPDGADRLAGRRKSNRWQLLLRPEPETFLGVRSDPSQWCQLQARRRAVCEPQNCCHVLAMLTQSRTQYGFGGHPYFSPNTPRASFSVASGEAFTSDENHQPITVIVVPATAAAGEAANLTDLIRYYLESDDILSKDWLSTVSLSRDPAEAKGASLEPTILTAADLLAVQREYGTHTFLLDPSISLGREADVGEPSANVKHLSTSDGFHGLRGPYLTKGRPGTDEVDLLPVFKLESDTYRTFMHGVYPVPGGSFRALHAVDDRGYNLIPLPSRLYSRCKEDDGVCGQRIAVKGTYSLFSHTIF